MIPSRMSPFSPRNMRYIGGFGEMANDTRFQDRKVVSGYSEYNNFAKFLLGPADGTSGFGSEILRLRPPPVYQQIGIARVASRASYRSILCNSASKNVERTVGEDGRYYRPISQCRIYALVFALRP